MNLDEQTLLPLKYKKTLKTTIIKEDPKTRLFCKIKTLLAIYYLQSLKLLVTRVVKFKID